MSSSRSPSMSLSTSWSTRSRFITCLPSCARAPWARRRPLLRSKACNARCPRGPRRARLWSRDHDRAARFRSAVDADPRLRRLHVCADGRVRSRGRHPVPPSARRCSARPHNELGCADLGWQRDLARARRACSACRLFTRLRHYFTSSFFFHPHHGVYALFPLAFAIILPALYFPILIMVVALIFRGIAFELRFKAAPSSRHRWDAAFHYGSLVATLAQGFVLGAFVQGFRVEGRFFVGGSFDWLRPFSVLTAISLVLGYGLLGATWLIMKTEGTLQDWARARARQLLIGVVISIGAVSLWTPFLDPRIMERWFSWPNVVLLSPLPIFTLWLALWVWRAIDRRAEFLPFLGAIALFTMGYVGLAISLWPNIVPHVINLWDAAAAPRSQAFLLVGTLFLLPVIVRYTAWSYWVFRGKVRAGGGYH